MIRYQVGDGSLPWFWQGVDLDHTSVLEMHCGGDGQLL